MSESKKYQNLTPTERVDMLESNADEVQKGFTFIRDLSKAEITQFRTELANYEVKLAQEKRLFKQVQTTHKQTIAPMQNGIKDRIEFLETETVTETTKAYIFLEQDLGRAFFYNEQGNLIYDRTLYPHEMQTTLYTELRKASEG